MKVDVYVFKIITTTEDCHELIYLYIYKINICKTIIGHIVLAISTFLLLSILSP